MKNHGEGAKKHRIAVFFDVVCERCRPAKGLVNGRSCCGHRDAALFFMEILRHARGLYLQVAAQRRAGKFVALLRRTAGRPVTYTSVFSTPYQALLTSTSAAMGKGKVFCIFFESPTCEEEKKLFDEPIIQEATSAEGP